MDAFKVLGEQHAEIVDAWIHELRSNKSSPYSREPAEDLHFMVNRSAEALREVLYGGAWDHLEAAITHIARRRLSQGFKLSEVQQGFMLYQQVVTPLIIRTAQKEELCEAIFRLGLCISRSVALLNDYFQGLHEEFIRQQTVVLEREVKKRTRELSRSESKYKSLVEDIRDGYYVVRDGIVVFANRAFCSMHGLSKDEIVGASFLELVAQESRENVARSHHPNQAPRASSLVEYVRLHWDGRKLPTETLARFSTYEGKAASLGICRDISERRELELKTREAETLNALAQQAASLAHDIRNPLTAIKMNVQMLSAELKENPTHHHLIEISQKEILNIERSVEEMMNLARPFRLNKETVALHPFIHGCVEALKSRMSHKEVTASVRLGRDLEQLKMDPNRMEHTLVNLLFNAIEAVPRGGHIYISSGLTQYQGGTWARITVADDGPGIPKELLPYLFDEKRNRRIGLGLDNVRKIVEAHGGAVEVSLRRPHGLRVSLRLPLEQ
jgi:PAS domain S-box-containing protein